MRNLAILQARMASTRLPGKALKLINGRPMIEWQILRIQESKVEELILATSTDDSDDELAKVARDLGIGVFRGAHQDVNSRFVNILEKKSPDFFIRLTGDCPVVMPNLIDDMIVEFESKYFDYLSNVNPPTFPDGLDVEVISKKAFLEFSKKELTDEEKEHVTLGMRLRPSQYKIGNFQCTDDLSELRWTVDYEEDYKFICNVFEIFKGYEIQFTMDDILHAIETGKILNNSVPHSFRNVSLRKVNQNEGLF